MARIPIPRLARKLRALWRSVPLARQVFLAMFCSIAAASSAYFLFDVYATNRRLLAMERSTLAAVFPILQGLIQDSMLSGDRGHVRDLFLGAERAPGAERLFLLDADKKAVDLDDLAAGAPARRHPAPSFDAASYLVMDFPLRAQSACLRCHEPGRKLLGWVRIAAEHQERVRAVSAHFRAHMTVLALMMLTLGVWALAIVRWLIQAPLRRIVGAMDAVARGRLGTRIDDLPPGELKEIGAGFNEMVAKLETDRREIVDLHRRQVAHMERLVSVGELAAQLAHEVRNPLTGIGSAVQIMQAETAPDSPRRDVLGKILGQLQRMDKTMASFLSFARMPEAVERPFDLNDPLGRVVFLIEPKLRAQGIRLERRFPEKFPTVTGDPGQMEQVFLNVALNAIQAMPRGGTLTLAARVEAEGGVTLEFSDTGHGIPADRLELVFKPFFTTREKGTGLGLPISKQIVMAHDGDMWIESVPERGTSVFMRLPAADVNGRGG